jgi:hypothetical protein
VLQRVAVGRWSLDAYRDIVPERILHELREQARALKGARILHFLLPRLLLDELRLLGELGTSPRREGARKPRPDSALAR